MFKMLSVLERRGEGILISLDVKGAFDRVWWAMLKAKLEACGLTGDALVGNAQGKIGSLWLNWRCV